MSESSCKHSTQSLGHKAASGAIWASLDRFVTMALQFIVNLLLARLLMPDDFGAIGMLAIFIAVSQVLIDGGFGSALIQKKSPTQTDYSTIFYWNLGFSTILYIVLFLVAPWIADFYSMPILRNVMRGIGVTLILNSIIAIQKVRLQKQFAFKSIAIANLSSYVFASIIAVLMAYQGWGVWSLVALQIIIGILSLSMYVIMTRWIPSRCFSKTSMKALFSFGGYILAAGILQEFCKNLQGIIIGKKFSASEMGYFSQAYKLDHVSSYLIPQVIVQVMYPVYSSIQDNKKRLIEIISMNIRVISFLIFPILTVLLISAEPLIIKLYGEKWIQSVPYFRILCVGGYFVCLQNINFYAVAAIGKSRQLFFWSFYKWSFLLISLIIGMIYGMYGILWGMVISNLNIYVINSYLVDKYVGLSLIKQLNCIMPIIFNILISFGSGMIINLYMNQRLFTTFLSILFYLAISVIFKYKSLNETKILAKRVIYKK